MRNLADLPFRTQGLFTAHPGTAGDLVAGAFRQARRRSRSAAAMARTLALLLALAAPAVAQYQFYLTDHLTSLDSTK